MISEVVNNNCFENEAHGAESDLDGLITIYYTVCDVYNIYHY